jgi:hypothetical protein
MKVIESIAYLTTPEGVKVQVLNEYGTDWDEAATYEAYNNLIKK